MSDPLDPRSYGAQPSGMPARARAPAPPLDDAAAGPGAEGAPELEADDRDLLVALAAMQLRYGEDAEAVAYLMAARRVFPGDADVLRLLADALLKLERVDEAAEVLAELEALPARRRQPIALMTKALVRLAQGRASEARRLFQQYRDAARRDAA